MPLSSLVYVATDDPTLLGLSAFIAAVGGVVSTILGNRRARHDEHEKDEENCRQRLKAARKEAEEAAFELHKRRMKYGN